MFVIPHGEERVFARLRTMLRIAGRTMRPVAHPSRRRFAAPEDEVLLATNPLGISAPDGLAFVEYRK
jgi:hypothetical protein